LSHPYIPPPQRKRLLEKQKKAGTLFEVEEQAVSKAAGAFREAARRVREWGEKRPPLEAPKPEGRPRNVFELIARAKVAEAEARRAMAPYEAYFLLRAGAGAVEGATFPFRPKAWLETGRSAVRLIRSREARRRVAEEIRRDPLGFAGEMLGGFAGGYVAGKGFDVLLGKAGVLKPKLKGFETEEVFVPEEWSPTVIRGRGWPETGYLGFGKPKVYHEAAGASRLIVVPEKIPKGIPVRAETVLKPIMARPQPLSKVFGLIGLTQPLRTRTRQDILQRTVQPRRLRLRRYEPLLVEERPRRRVALSPQLLFSQPQVSRPKRPLTKRRKGKKREREVFPLGFERRKYPVKSWKELEREILG